MLDNLKEQLRKTQILSDSCGVQTPQHKNATVQDVLQRQWVLPLLAVFLLIIVVLTGFAWYPPLHQGTYQPMNLQSFAQINEQDKININIATEDELQLLPGIGPVKAKEIISYRQKNNGFDCVEELLQVEGIGPKSLETLLELICV